MSFWIKIRFNASNVHRVAHSANYQICVNCQHQFVLNVWMDRPQLMICVQIIVQEVSILKIPNANLAASIALDVYHLKNVLNANLISLFMVINAWKIINFIIVINKSNHWNNLKISLNSLALFSIKIINLLVVTPNYYGMLKTLHATKTFPFWPTWVQILKCAELDHSLIELEQLVMYANLVHLMITKVFARCALGLYQKIV